MAEHVALQESWGQTTDPVGWGSQWIQDHQTSGKAANKPVILEEFGVTNNQSSTYTTWYNTVITSGLTGDLIWYACIRSPSTVLSNRLHSIGKPDLIYPWAVPRMMATL